MLRCGSFLAGAGGPPDEKQVAAHGAGPIDVEIVERNPRDEGFVPQPKHWRVIDPRTAL